MLGPPSGPPAATLLPVELASGDETLPIARCLELYRLMVRTRVLEERCIKMSKSGEAYFWVLAGLAFLFAGPAAAVGQPAGKGPKDKGPPDEERAILKQIEEAPQAPFEHSRSPGAQLV